MTWVNRLSPEVKAEVRAAKKAQASEDKARKLARAREALKTTEAKFRQPRARDAAFLSWLHEDIPCIACLIEGEPDTHGHPNPIEAAHQKLNIAAAGWTKVSGARVHDRQCVGLCRWHHQLAPNACDKGQRQFWARLGIGDAVADLCAELYGAFKGRSSGAEIVRRYADLGGRR